MKINKSYKTEIDPNKSQIILLNKSVGTARFVYNWGLASRIDEYINTGQSSNFFEQCKQLNKIKKTDFPWMYEVSKCSPQEALRDLDKAYENFFRRVKKGEIPGFPKFKSKHDAEQSCRLAGSICVESKRIRLPRIGWVRLGENDYIPIGIKSLSATISRRADRWFVSVLFEEEINPVQNKDGNVVGVDLGIKNLAVTSDNVVFMNPKALNKNLDKLARLQRKQFRQVKGSNNRKKTIKKIQRLHYRISNIRRDAIHKMTTAVAKTKPQLVVIEDLAVRNMLGNHRIARSISDASFGEIRRQFEYKALWNGFEVQVADRWFPSSKMCSCCGCIKVDLKLGDRTFICPECGLVIDRDLNASLNLKKYPTLSSRGSNACGDGGRKPRRDARKGKKQELKTMGTCV